MAASLWLKSCEDHSLPGSDSNETDEHVADCSKAVWGVKWYMWDVLIVHTTMWPKVSVSLKKAIFVYTGKIFMQVRASEWYIPLKAIMEVYGKSYRSGPYTCARIGINK